MSSSPHTGYAHLKAHLEAWNRRPQPHETASQEHFLHLTEEHLLPELQTPAAVLHEAGVDCTVFRNEPDTAGLGLRIENLQSTIGPSPVDHDVCLRAVVSRNTPTERPDRMVHSLHTHSEGAVGARTAGGGCASADAPWNGVSDVH